MSGPGQYIASDHADVPGWFAPEDMALFVAVDAAQKSLGVTGHVLEVGVYQGKSAILLGYFLGDEEELVVCDLFGAEPSSRASERENRVWYPDVSVDDFNRNFLRYHPVLPRTIIGQSKILGELCTPGTFRLIHIDGSHVYEDVRDDLLLSRELAAGSDCVVIIDDIRSAHTPGVWAAAWGCVVEEELVPLAVSHKMYATWGAPPLKLRNLIDVFISRDPRLEATVHPLQDGTNVLQVAWVQQQPQPPTRLRQMAVDWIPPKIRRRLRPPPLG